jgi:hypothetical protein
LFFAAATEGFDGAVAILNFGGCPMKGKGLWFVMCIIAASAIVAGCSASAQDPPRAQAQTQSPVHFSGVINDYPVSTNSTGATTGPWELRGPWSLDLQGQSGTASFSAALTMEFSDLSVGSTNALTDLRHQHTHQITMTGAVAVQNPPPGDCPSTPGTPSYNAQIEVTGMADVAGNGGYAFGPGVLVPLQVCLDGNSDVPISNVTLVFTKLASGDPSPATYHFGAQPIHGVVQISQ